MLLPRRSVGQPPHNVWSVEMVGALCSLELTSQAFVYIHTTSSPTIADANAGLLV
jgi:hypothetical protein